MQFSSWNKNVERGMMTRMKKGEHGTKFICCRLYIWTMEKK